MQLAYLYIVTWEDISVIMVTVFINMAVKLSTTISFFQFTNITKIEFNSFNSKTSFLQAIVLFSCQKLK